MVTVPPKSYPSTNIETDDIVALRNYLPGASTLEIVERFSAGLRGAKAGRMISVTGPYGSGKSTMAAFLNGLLAPKESREWKTAYAILKKEPDNYARALVYARKKAGVHEDGMIRCVVTARREPVSVTLLRAIDTGLTRRFGKYTKRDFASAGALHRCLRDLRHNRAPDTAKLVGIIQDVTRVSPIMIMIDEFGKNIEYFATDESQRGDLFLLQELAEKSSRRNNNIPLSIVTLQHMAFEEYAAGTSTAQKREWAKIQGRFEDVPFANSPNQTRLLVSSTIRLGDTPYRRQVMEWGKKESGMIQDLGIGAGADPELVASCYPLSPLVLEVLPEICSRYGQHERTLLSFISDSRRHTVASFIDDNYWDVKSPPVMGLDILYDYFISGTSMIHSSSANVSRLMEVEVIIRDAHGLDDTERKTLKTIGILNLVGRSGYLRASRRLIDYAVGSGSRQVLESLEKKSIITYRGHADEYRIWHGSDIDVAAKLDVYRRRYQNTSLLSLLNRTIRLEPVVTAKHGIMTGTMRLFGRKFGTQRDERDEKYDGAILYLADDAKIPHMTGPTITVTPGDTTELRFAAIEVSVIRDILESDDEVTSDWVARKEIEERLADAEVVLDREFVGAYGGTARWSYKKNGRKARLYGRPSAMASQVCDVEYPRTPIIRNEMINRTALSPQGSTAKKKLLEAMITRTSEPRFGIEGYGPERAIYEAVMYQNGLHVPDASLQWNLQDPQDGTMVHVWGVILGTIREARKRIVLTDIYKVAKSPPYGIRDGPLQLILVAMMILHKDTIALYEHGTFVPRLRPEVAERMTKNPEHFELKYFHKSPSKAALLKQVSSDLKIERGGVLDIVGHMVRLASVLPPYIKSTKKLDDKTIAVRDSLLHAIEPDTLLFESLPRALGFKSRMSRDEMRLFSKELAKSIETLQHGFSRTLKEIADVLFETTGIDGRTKISAAARAMEPDVSDRDMKIFLGALSADILEQQEDWIKYVAMSLTDVPPDDWKDDHREMFENSLRAISRRFKRLAGIHFVDVSGSFVKPSYQVTVTRADGSERHDVVSLRPEKEKRIKAVVELVKKEMEKRGLDDSDVGALLAILSSWFNADP